MKTSDSVTVDTSDSAIDDVVDQIERLIVAKQQTKQGSK
jgi:cytidylate kinase